jgi:iron complex transport system ATP-binding protein
MPGSILAIVGPNGSGKSTLLRCMAGLWPASEGHVTIDGSRLDEFRRAEIARMVTYVPQDTRFDFDFTVREIVLMGRYAHRGRFDRQTAEDVRAARDAMVRADVAHLEDRPVTQLSGGERQRVLIARSLATRAAILLLDEPTANLDIDHALELLELCRTLAREGRTLAVATHDLNAVYNLADCVALIDRGRLVACGEPAAVMTSDNLRRVFHVQAESLMNSDGTPVLLFRRCQTPFSGV